MNHHNATNQKGTRVSHAHSSARKPLLRRSGVAGLAHSGGFSGSGARSGARSSSVGFGGRTSPLKFVALAVAAAALLALTAGSASAAIVHPYQSQITEAGGSALGEPLGLAVDSTGDLYVSDAAKAALDKFDPANAPITAWGTNGQVTAPNGEALVKPFGLALDGTGDLWAVDQGAASVIKLEPDSSFLLRSTAEGRISTFAQSVAYSTAAERLFVMDSGSGELLALKPDGTFESTLANFGQCCFFKAAADNSPGATGGDIYVSGESNSVSRIHGSGAEAGQPDPFTFAAPYVEGAKLTGGPSGPFGTQGTGLGVKGLAVDSEGDLFVAGENGVFEFAPSGKAFGRITGTPTGPGGSLVPFGEVTAVGVGAASGNVYVGDSADHVVDVFGAGVIVPEVTTKPATNVTTTSATLNGEVNPEGLAVEECFFEWGTTTAYGELAPCAGEDPIDEIGTGTSPVAVHADVATLPSGATIHFRLVAKNANGTNNESADQSFLTGASIDSTSASEVSATAATLETELNPHGEATTYHFEYDTLPYAEGEEPHGIATPTGSAGSGTADVFRSAQVQGLQPLTNYHYRVVAENALGTVAGPDRTFTTQGPGAALLPDARAWELVTPPNKHGAPLQALSENGALIEAAAGGSAFTSAARAPLGPKSEGNRSIEDSQWLSQRGPAGWSTVDITTPHEEISEHVAGSLSEYFFFAPDLSSAIVDPKGATPLSPQTTEPTPYRRLSDGTFDPLLTEANVPAGTEFGEDVLFLTASPDAAHLVLNSRHLLTEEFQPGFTNPKSAQNLYELSAGKLRLASVLPDGRAASEAGFGSALGEQNLNMRGAISADGERLVFEAPLGGGHLYLRDNATQPPSPVAEPQPGHFVCTEAAGACTIQLDALQPGATGGPGLVQFQAASEDGSRVFFTDASRLTAGATAGPGAPDLYMCEIGLDAEGHLACALTDLSANHLNPSEPADVFGGAGRVSAIDAAGAHVYFTADGVLTESPDAEGEVARPADCRSAAEADCNLYVADTETGEVSLLAVLSSHDGPVWGHEVLELGGLTARSSPDGSFFTFMSTRSLTGYDNRDASSGRPDAEVYLYDADSGHLACASCNPTGARPTGVFDGSREIVPHLLVDGPSSWREHWLAASIPGWTLRDLVTSTYQSRFLADSGSLFFNAADALVPQDTNGVMDVYQFEPPGVGDCTTSKPTYGSTSGGCVSLISSGTSPDETAFLDASESGDDVFFLTASRLTPKDVDSAFDVYDARVGGGEPPILNPPECQGDACQQPAVPPNDPTPGSLTFNGAGNLLQCPRGKVKRHGKCVARKHHKAKHKKKGKKAKRTASHNRGGSK